MEMKKTVSKKAKKVAIPAKEFVAGQLAQMGFVVTTLVMIRSIAGSRAMVMLENGVPEIVSLNALRHLPEVFNGATV